MHDIIAGLGA